MGRTAQDQTEMEGPHRWCCHDVTFRKAVVVGLPITTAVVRDEEAQQRPVYHTTGDCTVSPGSVLLAHL